jgi:hypothetical protein
MKTTLSTFIKVDIDPGTVLVVETVDLYTCPPRDFEKAAVIFDTSITGFINAGLGVLVDIYDNNAGFDLCRFVTRVAVNQKPRVAWATGYHERTERTHFYSGEFSISHQFCVG